ncbi:MAG: hypothetical protein ACTSQF_01880 [Candidatus Heimdallarchaeaceae archaeon]
MRVILRPIAVNQWSGLKKYRNCHEDLAPYYTRSGQIYTGLTKLDETRLGEDLGLDLRPYSDYWKEFFIRTSGTDLYLNTEDSLDEIKYLFLKNHKRVKTSLLEHKATANFVLVNKDEEAKRSNIFNKIKRNANREFDKLSSEDVKQCLRLYGHNGDRMTAEVAEDRLFTIVDGNPQAFLDRWVNNKNRGVEVIIEKAIAKNVIRKNKNVYKYGTDTIAHSMGEAVDFLHNPKNQDIKIAIMTQLESKETIIDPYYKQPEVDMPETETKSFDHSKKSESDDTVGTKNSSTPQSKGDTI